MPKRTLANTRSTENLLMPHANRKGSHRKLMLRPLAPRTLATYTLFLIFICVTNSYSSAASAQQQPNARPTPTPANAPTAPPTDGKRNDNSTPTAPAPDAAPAQNVPAQNGAPAAARPSPAPRRPAAATSTAAPAKKVLTPQQQRSLYLLESLGDEAKKSDDPYFASVVRAQVADALWRHDEPRARRELETAFRQINESAKASGAAAREFPALFSDSTPDMRAQLAVLRVAAMRDPQLAQKMIQSLEEAVAPDAEQSATQTLSPQERARKQMTDFFGERSQRATLYLTLALQLVETDTERAVQFARQGLANSKSLDVMTPGVLLTLRMKNVAVADELFRIALAVARRDAAHFSWNVNMLASYVFVNEDMLGMLSDLDDAVDALNRRNTNRRRTVPRATNDTDNTEADAAPPDADSSNDDANATTRQEDRLEEMFGVQSYAYDQNFLPLARQDFDRALGIAQLIKRRETSILAQLAACRGVLTEAADK